MSVFSKFSVKDPPVRRLKFQVLANNWLLNVNIRSLNCNFDEFQLLVDSFQCKPTVICLTETWLNTSSDMNVFALEGYFPILSQPGLTRNEGVAIYIHKSLFFEQIRVENPMNVVGVKCINSQ